MTFRILKPALVAGAAILAATAVTGSAFASSHMDAPLITLDDPANTTDVYAFRSQSEDGAVQYLTTALAVYPFEEPGIGPNNFRFDDNVLYTIHVALEDDVADGKATVSYEFEFKTSFQNQDTIRQAFLGPIDQVFGANQNLRQTYTVTKVEPSSRKRTIFGRPKGKRTELGKDLPVPPNNQGLVTPFYNQNDDGESRAKEGVLSEADLDRYTKAGIRELKRGYRSFAGQRDDGFYADIQSIFDLDFGFSGANKPFDSQGGFNLHTLVLNIPMSELGDAKVAGVYATTSRRKLTVRPDAKDAVNIGQFVQVGRQGNPLFAEALVALRDKDLYNLTSPTQDDTLFKQYAESVEIANLLNLTPVVDIVGLFIPDVIKVDLTTGPARLANQAGFDRNSIFGDDVLTNAAGETVAGGWPNGRRFGDDVVDIALFALGLDVEILVDGQLVPNPVDRVLENDITYNDVFPYAATPLNGRNHPHHGQEANLSN